MGHITKETIHATLPAILSNGQSIEFKAVIQKKNVYYQVAAIETRIDSYQYHQTLAVICKSSKDILLLSDLLHTANRLNDFVIHNITKSAEEFSTSRKNLTELLNRAVDASLLHKIDTGHYFVNPFLYMSKAAVGNSDYKQQELVQARWRETTGLLSQSDIASLVSLSTFLGQAVTLPGTEFNLSVAYYYSKHKIITPKQITAYKKRGVIPANWSISDVNRSY